MLQHSSPVKELREASVASSKKLNAFYVEMAMRKDNFDRICAFRELQAFNDLTQEQKRMVEKIIVEGKRNGLHLDEEARNQVTSLYLKVEFKFRQYPNMLVLIALTDKVQCLTSFMNVLWQLPSRL